MAYERELLKGNTDFMLLVLLGEQPRYGYQLSKEVKARSMGYFSFKEGTLYPALHRLEHAGLVTARWEASPSGQQRRYYHITVKGLKAVKNRMRSWRSFASALDLVLQPITAS